ncbi:hypothetical protein FHL81_18890 [Agrobacterium tumefaciens]|nr:hypothetical protein FHL81_18890 [Agrobacterium tumefaciens]KAB0457346.1 hypothetical protein F7R04_22600 [Agrobacterium tumefaciens]MQB38533.1 hypothetical protein [Agrobacterium tumefaciens]TGE77055.1 hypothetical protein C9410_21350 [Rhizobium sp. SEMIA 439]
MKSGASDPACAAHLSSRKFFSKKVLAKSSPKKIDKKNFYLFILRERSTDGPDRHANRQKSSSDSRYWQQLITRRSKNYL